MRHDWLIALALAFPVPAPASTTSVTSEPTDHALRSREVRFCGPRAAYSRGMSSAPSRSRLDPNARVLGLFYRSPAPLPWPGAGRFAGGGCPSTPPTWKGEHRRPEPVEKGASVAGVARRGQAFRLPDHFLAPAREIDLRLPVDAFRQVFLLGDRLPGGHGLHDRPGPFGQFHRQRPSLLLFGHDFLLSGWFSSVSIVRECNEKKLIGE